MVDDATAKMRSEGGLNVGADDRPIIAFRFDYQLKDLTEKDYNVVVQQALNKVKKVTNPKVEDSTVESLKGFLENDRVQYLCRQSLARRRA